MPKLVNPYGLVKVRPQRAPPSAVARYSFLHAPCRHACPRLVAGCMVYCCLQPKTQRYRKPWAEGQADTVRPSRTACRPLGHHNYNVWYTLVLILVVWLRGCVVVVPTPESAVGIRAPPASQETTPRIGRACAAFPTTPATAVACRCAVDGAGAPRTCGDATAKPIQHAPPRRHVQRPKLAVPPTPAAAPAAAAAERHMGSTSSAASTGTCDVGVCGFACFGRR